MGKIIKETNFCDKCQTILKDDETYIEQVMPVIIMKEKREKNKINYCCSRKTVGLCQSCFDFVNSFNVLCKDKDTDQYYYTIDFLIERERKNKQTKAKLAWYSVDTKLPPESTHVLTVDDDVDLPEIFHNVHINKGKFLIVNNPKHQKVTHWAYIPNFPDTKNRRSENNEE